MVEHHDARASRAAEQDLVQANEAELSVPGMGCRPLRQWCVPVGPEGCEGVHASALRFLVGDDRLHAWRSLGVVGEQGRA